VDRLASSLYLYHDALIAPNKYIGRCVVCLLFAPLWRISQESHATTPGPQNEPPLRFAVVGNTRQEMGGGGHGRCSDERKHVAQR